MIPKISKSILQSLGLSEMQAQVYVAALELGQATMQDMARKSGVKRTSIYNFIDELKDKRLIVETKKKKRTLYGAVHPERLIEMEEGRLRELQKIIPELLAIHNQQRKKPRVIFYEGLDGIKEVYADTLREKEPIIAWSDWDHMRAIMDNAFYEWYPKERARRGITFKTIARDTEAAREVSKKDVGTLREQKFITTGDLKTEINIYGDKVAMMSFRTTPPFAVLIEDLDIAETLRVTWQELWKRLE